MNIHECDLVVIGSGPGGYVAAVRATQLGLKTICVERGSLGGVCLNWGCIPTKALLKSAEYKTFMDHSSDFGIDIKDYSVDFAKVVSRSREIADRMSKGVGYLFKKYKIEHVVGNGKLKSASEVEVSDADGNVTNVIKAKNIVIATGARSRIFPGIEVDYKRIITSTEAMIPKDVPAEMIIMGSGAIGMEFAYFYNAFGTKVTIVEMMDRIMPLEDADVSKEVARHYKKSKIKLMTKTKVMSAKTVGDGVEVTVENKKGETVVLKADIALNAIGIQPNFENLGLEELGIELNRGYINTDDKMQTNIAAVYAIGDIAGAPWLAHKASAEGVHVAEVIAGQNSEGLDYGNIPGCTYCSPQVASIGLTEEKAAAAGHELRIGKFPFTANGKAHSIGEAKGFVKLIFDAGDDKLLGAHLVGPDVTEMLGELGLARKLGATGKDILQTIHAHPTLNEAVMEAAADAYGEAVNL